MFPEEDTRPRVRLTDITHNKECVVVLDEAGLVIGHRDASWLLTWEKLEELKEEG